MESFTIDKGEFVIFVKFIESRKNIFKRSFKSIPFVSTARVLCDKSNQAVSAYILPQWFVKMKRPFNRPTLNRNYILVVRLATSIG